MALRPLSTRRRRVTSVLLLLAALAGGGFGPGARGVSAQETPPSAAADEYQRIVRDALSEYNSGNFAEAQALFERAHALRPSARTFRGLGRASFELKQYVRAKTELKAALDDARLPLTPAQRDETSALLARVQYYVAKLSVTVTPATAEVVVDGHTIHGEVELDMGEHTLRVQAAGYRTLTSDVTMDGGKPKSLEFKLEPLELQPTQLTRSDSQRPSEAATPIAPVDHEGGGVFTRWWFWTIVGVVVAGGAVTVIALTSQTKQQPPLAGDTGGTIATLRSGSLTTHAPP